jgi:signal transduction histidine kinase/CheY-like chemotaxis protein
MSGGSERLLVLAPTGRDALLATDVLRRAGLTAEPCASVADLCAEIERGAGAVLLTEEVLTAPGLRTLAGVIAAQEPWSDLPVVVFSSAAPHDAAGAADPLEALGNVTLVDRPLRRRTLVSVARAALRARRRQYAARGILAEVREAVRQRDAFLALLGHELRNPLAAIELAGQLLDRGARPERQLAVVRRQTRQLARIVEDLLDVSRVTSGKVTLRRGVVDLRAVAERCVELQAAGEGGGVDVACDGAGDPAFVYADEARLEQVIANLVSNAVKYTPPGGRVRVSVAREGGDAVLRVADDGVGLAEEDLARIFQPFVQVESSLDRARGGMGLGLTLVRALVGMHGGAVEARSAGRGRGSEFVVRLAAVAAPADAAPAAGPTPRGVCRDLLVVDDNDDVREAFVAALEHAGHRVRAAADAFSALALAREQPPQVAFLDIGLPGMDGYELARRLRAEHGARTVLVAVSGYGQPEDRDRSREAGFDLHLTKPVELERVDALLCGGDGRADW